MDSIKHTKKEISTIVAIKTIRKTVAVKAIKTTVSTEKGLQ